MLRRNAFPALVTALAAAALLALPPGARAFDTGHHYDLTREALAEEGFGNTAIQIVQVENWLTDYYSSQPLQPAMGDELARMHFDNLFTTGQVRNYWGRLAINTRAAVQQAARDRDVLALLTLLGCSLHAVQDFYTHSNWVETHQPPPVAGWHGFRTETWFDDPPGPRTPNLYTGSYPDLGPGGVELHGDYDSGMNHDSYVQPRWAPAYVFGYAASRRWVNAVHGWVEEARPGFWRSARTYVVSGGDREDLDYDLRAVYRLSEWINVAGGNGHWKGNGSGSVEFETFALAWSAAHDSRFVKQFKERHIYRQLTDGLTGDQAPPSDPPAIPRLTFRRKAVMLRTTHVEEKDDVALLEQVIDSPGGRADFYAKVTIAGQTFVEAMQGDRSSINPHWTTITFVPAATREVSIRYALWDEDGGTRGDDDHCDINPAKHNRDLEFTFALDSHRCSGDVTGIHDGAAQVFRSAGRKPQDDRAVVEFFVTAFDLR